MDQRDRQIMRSSPAMARGQPRRCPLQGSVSGNDGCANGPAKREFPKPSGTSVKAPAIALQIFFAKLWIFGLAILERRRVPGPAYSRAPSLFQAAARRCPANPSGRVTTARSHTLSFLFLQPHARPESQLARIRETQICRTFSYGLWSSSSSLDEGGGFTLSQLNVPSAGRWFASTSIKQGADTCMRMGAHCMTGPGSPFITPPVSSVPVQRAQSCSILGRANINASSSLDPCSTNNRAAEVIDPAVTVRSKHTRGDDLSDRTSSWNAKFRTWPGNLGGSRGSAVFVLQTPWSLAWSGGRLSPCRCLR